MTRDEMEKRVHKGMVMHKAMQFDMAPQDSPVTQQMLADLRKAQREEEAERYLRQMHSGGPNWWRN